MVWRVMVRNGQHVEPLFGAVFEARIDAERHANERQQKADRQGLWLTYTLAHDELRDGEHYLRYDCAWVRFYAPPPKRHEIR